MAKLNILRGYFEPNIASINRCLAFSKGYGELGVNTEVVFVFPNAKREKVNGPELRNVSFKYLWDRYYPKNKYLMHIFCRFYLINFILKLKKDDIVLLYGAINPWFLFFFNSKIKIYNEITEHPTIHIRKNGLIGKIQYWCFKKFCQRIDGVLPISPSLSNFFVNEFGIKNEKVCTVNMIVDATRFKNIKLKEKRNTITYCGTISERKDGISDLLKAFKIVSILHTSWTLKLIGDFENNMTKINVHALLQTLGIQNKVVITGVVEAEQMPLMLSESSILVLSRPQSQQAKYGFPTKLGEYLMTENPVVLTNVGDFSLYLKDKESVVFAEPDNFNDFAEKIFWVLNNYEEAKKIGKVGKKLALRKFNYKVECKKVLDFIQL